MQHYIDAHCHLPKNKSLTHLIDEFNHNHVKKGILILNTPEEKSAFLSQCDVYLKHQHRLGIVLGYDVKKSFKENDFHNFEKLNIPFGLKFHSRLMQYTKQDIPKIIASLQSFPFSNIIVDGFMYGHQLQFHCQLDMFIEICTAFPHKNITFAHSGGIDLLKTMLLTRTLNNAYYDLSLTVQYLFNTSVHQDMLQFIKFNSSKIMFGSDFPDFTLETSIQKFSSLFQELNLPSCQVENIFFNNANTLYSSLWRDEHEL